MRASRLTAPLAAALSIGLLGSTFAQSRDAGASQRPAGTASLTGRVMRDNSRPVARAAVTISASDSAAEYQTVTDDDGRFVFERLPAGRFLVTASRTGWVTSFYGSPRPGYPPGVRVAIEEGGRASIEIPMVPGSVIAGRVVNEDGRPMPRQSPWLLESRMVGDRRMLGRARMPYDIGNFERGTNDLGEFRLFGLPPGTYYLLVAPSMTAGARVTTDAEVRWALQAQSVGQTSPPAPPQSPVVGYATFYFPGTTDPAQAQPIVVGPGEVREGLTFRVGFVPVARVSGMARRPDGTPAASSSVTLRHRQMKASLEGSDRTARTDAAGRFTFQSVPPGDYRLTMRATSGAPSLPDLWGQTDVVIAGSDIDGVTLALAPASTIEGRIVFDGGRAPPEPDTIRLHFIATEAMAMAMSGAGMSRQPTVATLEPDGTFRAAGLPPDRYLVGASWPGMRTGDGTSGWWITSIQVGARDLGDAPIDVAPNADVGDVTITFSDRIGVIEGMLTDPEGRPAPEYFVLAFPVERTSWTTVSRRMVPPVRPATDGRFRIAGLPAGEYYLAVVTTMDPDAGTDPEFLESILPGAIKIAVAEGETKRQDLRIGR